MEPNLQDLLIQITQYEQKMESYRQLLNEQIQFNIKDLYIQITGNHPQVTAYHLHLFINQHSSQSTPLLDNHSHQNATQDIVDIGLIESMIKSYNNCTSMNLSFIQFALIFLSRQNKLLSKLTIERNSLGQMPQYLLNYGKKILRLEAQLHGKLQQFRRSNSIPMQNWIKENTINNTDKEKDSQAQQELFDEKILIKMCQELSINYQLVQRSLKINQKELTVNKMLSVFTLKNCSKLSQLLKKSQKGLKSHLLGNKRDPFIRAQFHDCLQRPKIAQNFSYRQLKSIQKHLQRLSKEQNRQQKLRQRIKKYSKFIQKQLILLCEGISKIIELEEEIERERIQLHLCTDFYPVLFYQTFEKDRELCVIPSAFQAYLGKFGIEVQLSHLYLIFKRYSSRIDGKLSFNQFCLIFDLATTDFYHIQRNRLVNSLDDIGLETIRAFFKLIKKLVKNQLKIQAIKIKLQQTVNLREIFHIFDTDEDGYISMLDFRVAWKKYLLMDLSQDKLGLLWHRMRLNRCPSTMVKYEKFISELSPRLAKMPLKEQNERVKTGKQKKIK